MSTSPAVETHAPDRKGRVVPASRSHRLKWRALDHVQAALVGMQYGQVTVVVQDGLIVQVERTERTRLPKGNSDPS
jgi:hypothetical protein